MTPFMERAKQQMKLMDMQNREFVYCDNKKCNHTWCLRRIENATWYTIIHMNRYFPEKNGKCKYEIKE